MTYSSAESLAKALRLDVLKMIHQGKSSHIGAVFSMMEILAVLYHDVLRFRPEEPGWKDRDRVILSKGHAGAGIYAVLAEYGFFPKEMLMTHCANGSLLSGHVSHKNLPGVEFSTGSLGHGLPVGVGMSYAMKQDGCSGKVYVILGDGECEEGTTWESAMFAARHRLDNLTVIVDRNRQQGLGRCDEILALEPLNEKWKAFNWNVKQVNGHSCPELLSAFRTPRGEAPLCIIAKTVKGKGVNYMENSLEWHYRSPQGALYEQALAELEGKQE